MMTKILFLVELYLSMCLNVSFFILFVIIQFNCYNCLFLELTVVLTITNKNLCVFSRKKPNSVVLYREAQRESCYPECVGRSDLCDPFVNKSSKRAGEDFIWNMVFRIFGVNDDMWQSVTAISVAVKSLFCFLSPIQNVANKSSLAFAY